MTITIFPEPLDSVRNDKHELVLAETLLKFLMLTPDGAWLSTTHAIDSSVLLTQSTAGNPAFRALIQDGRLRFATWPDGKGPRQAFQKALAMSNEDYRLTAWPELESDPSLRRLALDKFNGTLKTTGVATLDERLELAETLFRSAESADSQLPDKRVEKLRGQLFADSLARAPQELPKGETTKNVAESALQLSQLEGRHSRSIVYDWIDKRDLSPRDNALLKDLVDARYNFWVAYSLDVPFYSVRRVWRNLPPDRHEAQPRPSSLRLYRALHPESVLQPIPWDTLARAVAPYAGKPYSKDDAVLAFNELLSHIARYHNALAVGGAIAGVTAAIAINIAIGGAARDWLLDVIRGLATAASPGTGILAGRGISSFIQKKWRAKQTQRYASWLDSFEADTQQS